MYEYQLLVYHRPLQKSRSNNENEFIHINTISLLKVSVRIYLYLSEPIISNCTFYQKPSMRKSFPRTKDPLDNPLPVTSYHDS